MSTDGGGIGWHTRRFRSITIFISHPFCKVNRFACRGSFGTTNLRPSIIYHISARLSIEIAKITVIFLRVLNYLIHSIYILWNQYLVIIYYNHIFIFSNPFRVNSALTLLSHNLFPARRRLPTYVTYIIFRKYSPHRTSRRSFRENKNE